MQIEIRDAKTEKKLLVLENLGATYTIADVKQEIYMKRSRLYPDRQALRLEPRSKALSDDETLASLRLPDKGAQLYLRDLGPQIGWKTVFLIEYAGPFLIYPIFYLRPSLIYGEGASAQRMAQAVHLACACWSLHYGKRLFETVAIHRFSHGTMPLLNVFKNSSYYWGFTAFVSYFVNHPLYTAPDYGDLQVAAGLALFLLAETGNLSIHIALRNLRPAGSKVRRIPMPTANPFTWLFAYVSCPNYTYEALSWLGFSVLTQTLPALIFTAVGFGQMAIWALGKHRNYKREFANYPRQRKAIVPFLL